MSLLKSLRRRREMTRLYEQMKSEMPALGSQAMGRKFQEDNNYFATAMFHSAIKKAFKSRQYDTLEVYSRYLHSDLPLEGVWHATAVLSESQKRPVGEIVNDSHVLVAHQLLTAFREHHDYELFRNYGTYRDILRLAYDRPEHTSRIIALVEKRDIETVDEIDQLLNNFPEMPQSLLTGMI